MSGPDPGQMNEQELMLEHEQSRLAAYAALGSAASILVAIGLYMMAMNGADLRSKVSLLEATHAHSSQLILSGLFRTVSFALLAIVLGFLAAAAKRRVPELPPPTIAVAYAGPALAAISAPIATLAQVKAANTFVEGGQRTGKAAEAALDGSLVSVAQYGFVFAAMLLAISWVVVGLYCMRSGLLTRLLGGVAIGIGLLTVISVYGPSVLALAIGFFWLLAVAVMLLATEETRPPAWKLGVAVTWREVAAAKAEAAQAQPADEL